MRSKHFLKLFLSIALVFTMILGLSVPGIGAVTAYAEDSQNIQMAGGNADVENTLDEEVPSEVSETPGESLQPDADVKAEDEAQTDAAAKTEDDAQADAAVKTEDETQPDEAVKTEDETQADAAVKTEDEAQADAAEKIKDKADRNADEKAETNEDPETAVPEKSKAGIESETGVTADEDPANNEDEALLDGNTQTDYAETVITDPTLQQIIRMLVNYSIAVPGASLYDLIRTEPYREAYAQYGNRITEYSDLRTLYDKPVSQTELESYSGMIDLWDYSEITGLSGLNHLIRATEVRIPKNSTGIEGKTFTNMAKLKTVHMPDSVGYIGDGAFEKCESLTRLYVFDNDTGALIAPAGEIDPNDPPAVICLKGVSAIGNSAFAACVAIEKVEFDNSIESISIDSNAFSSCSSLSNVVVPKGTLGNGVFSSCHNMHTIVFDDSYTTIPSSTLAGIKNPLNITFPAGLVEIGAYACTGDTIMSMNLSACTELTTIGEYAFQNTIISAQGTTYDLSSCTKLETICREAFSGADFISGTGEPVILVSLPDSINAMGSAVFFNASGFQAINYPASMEIIPEGAFMLCYDLQHIYNTDKVTTIGAHAFDLCGQLNFSDLISAAKTNLTTIGDYAFARCIPDKNHLAGELSTQIVTLPASVSSVGSSAFENDFTISELNIGSLNEGITEIPDRLAVCDYARSPVWTDVTLTDPVSGSETLFPLKTSSEPAYTSLRNRYTYSTNLSEMSSLRRIRMSYNVTSIGNYAIAGNSALTTIYCDPDSISIGVAALPAGLTSIGAYAFAYCAKHEIVNGESRYSGLTVVEIPDTVNEIGEYAFYNDFSLYRVKLPVYLESIPAHCFENCGHDRVYDNEHHYHGLTEISNLSKVKSIGDSAFRRSYCLRDGIEFGRNLEYLGKNSFEETDIVSATSLMYASDKLEKIETYTFNKCRNLTAVYCPDSIEAIGDHAFCDCPNLDRITFPVYATLSATMLENNTQMITLTPTLGRYLGTVYVLPKGTTQSLPANAFARRSSEKISQLMPDGTDVEISKADPKYFDVVFNKNEYLITGGDIEVERTAVRISATVPFNKSASRTMSIDYPLSIISVHADPNEMAYDESKIKIGSSTGVTLFDKEGTPCLYVNKNNIGKVLKLVLNAKSTNPDYPGTITDNAVWTVIQGSNVVSLKGGSESKKDSDVQVTTSADFDIINTGTAVVRMAFPDGTANPPSKNIRIEVIDPISRIDYTLQSTGEDHKNPASLMMPVGQSDAILAVPTYSNPDDTRDFITFKSSDSTVVSVDSTTGEFTAQKEGTARITIGTASGSASKTLTITVKPAGSVIDPLFLTINGPVDESGKVIVYCGETSTFTATCLPAYATQNVDWSVNYPADVDLQISEGKALVTGITPDKTITITAKAESGNAKSSLSFVTRARTEDIEFRENPPFIAVNATGSIRLSSSTTQTNGIVRIPEASWEDVTFTTDDATVLLLGTSSSKTTEETVTLSGKTAYLYYKGINPGEATIIASLKNGKTATLKVTVIEAPITSITCLKRNVTMVKGESTKMQIQTQPEKTADPVVFTSSNPDIATVDANGMITAVSEGTVRITATSSVRHANAYCDVTVMADKGSVEIKGMPSMIEPGFVKSILLTNNESTTAGIIRHPEVNLQDVTITSSDSSVLALGTSGDCSKASVTLSGRSANLFYKGLKTGKSILTVRTESGATCKYTISVVKNPVKKLEYTGKGHIRLLKNKKIKMPLAVTPADTEETITYKSSNTAIAKVSSTGVITAVAPGMARITASTKFNNLKASCIVNVLAPGSKIQSNGNTYTVNDDNTLTFSAASQTATTIAVPSTVSISGLRYKVVKVANYAFSNRTKLKKVLIRQNVTSIGKNAFYNCSSLRIVVLNSTVIKTIDTGAFQTIANGATFRLPAEKYAAYIRLLKKSGLPKKYKWEKI